MNDAYLRPFSDGPLYHHEALNGTGYPQGLKKKDIPYSAQIIRVCDEYDALVSKRNYQTHVNISETLKELIKHTKSTKSAKSLVALIHLKEDHQDGIINKKPLKALFSVVIDDILYEISCIMNYQDYLTSQIKRLQNIDDYNNKFDYESNPSKKEYYMNGIQMLLENGETLENYSEILKQYENALVIRKKRIDDLYKEIKIIKRLKFWL